MWKRLIAEPAAPAAADLDTAESVQVRARLIRAKPVLRRYYDYCYRQLVEAAAPLAAGPRIELGSGGGFLAEYVPELVETDVMEGARPRLVMSGERLPLRDSSVAVIYCMNVVHHIPDPEAFFREVGRVVRPGGGVVMVEPANTWLSSFIYQHFHHEGFDPTADWKLAASGGPLSTSNQALPWILFFRDRELFARKFPGLKVTFLRFHSSLLYILSGGVSLRQLVPGWGAGLTVAADRALGPLQRFLALFMTIRVERV